MDNENRMKYMWSLYVVTQTYTTIFIMNKMTLLLWLREQYARTVWKSPMACDIKSSL